MAREPDELDYLSDVALFAAPDAILQRLVWLASDGFGPAITVVVGGTMISGSLAMGRDFGAHYDRAIDEGLKAAKQEWPGNADVLEQLRETMSKNNLEGKIETARKEAEEIEQEVFDLEDRGEDLPPDLERKFNARRTFAALTLRDAITFSPGAGEFEVEFVRVQLRQVDAWFIGKAQRDH